MSLSWLLREDVFSGGILLFVVWLVRAWDASRVFADFEGLSRRGRKPLGWHVTSRTRPLILPSLFSLSSGNNVKDEKLSTQGIGVCHAYPVSRMRAEIGQGQLRTEE